MHAVAVPKGVLVLLPLYIQCSTSSVTCTRPEAVVFKPRRGVDE